MWRPPRRKSRPRSGFVSAEHPPPGQAASLEEIGVTLRRVSASVAGPAVLIPVDDAGAIAVSPAGGTPHPSRTRTRRLASGFESRRISWPGSYDDRAAGALRGPHAAGHQVGARPSGDGRPLHGRTGDRDRRGYVRARGVLWSDGAGERVNRFRGGGRPVVDWPGCESGPAASPSAVGDYAAGWQQVVERPSPPAGKSTNVGSSRPDVRRSRHRAAARPRR